MVGQSKIIQRGTDSGFDYEYDIFSRFLNFNANFCITISGICLGRQ